MNLRRFAHLVKCSLSVSLLFVSLQQARAAQLWQHEVVLSGMRNPWAIVPGPDRRLYITETSGSIRVWDMTGQTTGQLAGVPEVANFGQGGLLDLVFHPRFAENRWVYLAYTTGPRTGLFTRITRFSLSGTTLTAPHPILDGPDGRDGAHFGCRLVFARDGKLYATFGERHQKEKAQSLQSLHGKVVRLNENGSIPVDNPFVNVQGARKEIFTYGHRNPQGLDVHPQTGALYVSEHGPTGYDAPHGGDEINLLAAGKNYGWPEISHRTRREGMESPIDEYTPAVAPSGAVFYTGDALPEWRNHFFFAALAGTALYRLHIEGQEIRERERLLHGTYGRLRDVTTGPDGNIYVLATSGKLVRLKGR